ncbi:ABC transporter permease [Paenibacillus swuensis]|nr:ABC transporter permease subunit [Paenibacillus swuensis]
MLRNLYNHRLLLFMLLPGLLYFIVFHYMPMAGLLLAFTDYTPSSGLADSNWVGLEHFKRLASEPTLGMLVRNTVLLFLFNVLITFPLPVMLAFLFHELKKGPLSSFVQNALYLPYFLSWVVVVSLFYVLFEEAGSPFQKVLEAFGLAPVHFMLEESWFRLLYTGQNLWREVGWETLIYVAAISSINKTLYDAAKLDGAGRYQLMLHITWPGIRNMVYMLLILKCGHILDLGFEHAMLLINPVNRSSAEILDTYMYTAGILGGQFGYTTAISLFKSAVGVTLLLCGNAIIQRVRKDEIL